MILSVKVKPNSRDNRISKENDVITIRIHAPAHEGKANKAIVEFLSELMDIPKSFIGIVGGTTSPHKKISIADEYKMKVEETLAKI
jgi:uncharacterized protein (TIGR00251 family)